MIKVERYCCCRSRIISGLVLLLVIILSWACAQASEIPSKGPDVPILLYHRLAPTVRDGMTVTTKVFESHLKYLRDNGYRVIPLRQLTDYYTRGGAAPPPKSVVIVEDDAHISVYTEMLPLVKRYNVPVTVFVYPSAISNASYAMTWQQLHELKKTGLFDIQSHTYWHPNFKREQKRLSSAEYDKFVDLQLKKPKARLEKELGGEVSMLAWPFGIHDDRLVGKAAADGYRVAFTIEPRHAGPNENPMKLPRFLMVNSDQGVAFRRILEASYQKKGVGEICRTKQKSTPVPTALSVNGAATTGAGRVSKERGKPAAKNSRSANRSNSTKS